MLPLHYSEKYIITTIISAQKIQKIENNAVPDGLSLLFLDRFNLFAPVKHLSGIPELTLLCKSKSKFGHNKFIILCGYK